MKGKTKTARIQRFRNLAEGEHQRNCPKAEDVDNPNIAPQDYDVRQSERVWEFQNRDFWIRPTDLSLHFPNLVTIREMHLNIVVEGHLKIKGQRKQD